MCGRGGGDGREILRTPSTCITLEMVIMVVLILILIMIIIIIQYILHWKSRGRLGPNFKLKEVLQAS